MPVAATGGASACALGPGAVGPLPDTPQRVNDHIVRFSRLLPSSSRACRCSSRRLRDRDKSTPSSTSAQHTASFLSSNAPAQLLGPARSDIGHNGKQGRSAGTRRLGTPVLSLCGTFREVLSVSRMDMDVGDDLLLGWDSSLYGRQGQLLVQARDAPPPSRSPSFGCLPCGADALGDRPG